MSMNELDSYRLRDTEGWKNYYDGISRFVNGGSDQNREGFVAAFLSDHNTLQQQATALLLTCLYQLAQTQYTDARNEYAVKLAKTAIEAIEPLVLVRDGEIKLGMI